MEKENYVIRLLGVLSDLSSTLQSIYMLSSITILSRNCC